MFLKPKDKVEGEPWFTLHDYLFGNNLGAATLQILMAGGVVMVIYMAIGLVAGQL